LAIRRTYYTPSDDFSTVMGTDDARTWLRSRGFLVSAVIAPDGTRGPGQTLEDLDEEDLARWVAAADLSVIRRKAEEGGQINVRTEDGEWVSILAERVESVGASVVDDDVAVEDAQPYRAWPADFEFDDHVH
jgi:hypothetical protein